MRFLLTRFGLINVDHIVEIRKSWAGLRIELTNGETRDVKLPEGVDVDALLEELSLQMIRSQIVDLESILEKFQDKCGHKDGTVICGHKESIGPMIVDTTGAPASVDTYRIQDVDTDSAAKSVDTKEDVHRVDTDEIRHEEEFEENLVWIEINERIRYAHDEENEVFILQHKKDGRFQTLKIFRYEDLKKIWDSLPERATAEDIKEAARRVGVNIGGLGHYLMRIFTHVKFGGDITSQRTGGHPRMVLIKNPDDCFFREEIRKQLKLERDLIGEVDSYGGV